MKIIF